MEYDKVKDSGARQSFSTGAVRDIQTGKGRYDLIPAIPLRRLARHYENGSAKYGDWNWSKGMPVSRFLNSAIRHLFNYAEGDRSEDHLSAAVFNIFSIEHEEEVIERGLLPKELYDIPSFVAPPPKFVNNFEALKAMEVKTIPEPVAHAEKATDSKPDSSIKNEDPQPPAPEPKQEYPADIEGIERFLIAKCVLHPDATVKAKALIEEYKSFVEKPNVDLLSDVLHNGGITIYKKREGMRNNNYLKGITLKGSEPASPPTQKDAPVAVNKIPVAETI